MPRPPTVTPEACRLFHEGQLAFAQVEANGMRIDVPLLRETIAKVKSRIKHLEHQLKSDEVFKAWRKHFGTKMKLSSRPQLAHIVHTVMGVPVNRLTKTGKPGMDESDLEKIDQPFVKAFVEIEKLKKVLSTNLNGIRRELVGDLIRPFFHLDRVVTWRGSSSEINFQNLPNRNPLHSKLVRRLFIPREGHVLLEVDLKANEVRVACCYSKDEKLISDTLEGDMHRDMAAKCFMLPETEVPKPVRQLAKGAFVFAEFYGDYYCDKRDGSPGVARNLWEGVEQNNLTNSEGKSLLDHLADHGITELGRLDPRDKNPPKSTFERHIKDVEDEFWNVRFKDYNRWRTAWWEEYQRNGWFQTLTGFVDCGIHSKNEVINSPIQGSAFHCLLWVLIELQKWLRKKKMRSLIIGQIHDSIEIDCHRDELEDVIAKIFELLRTDIRRAWPWLIVPLEGEAEVSATNWFEKKEIEVPA